MFVSVLAFLRCILFISLSVCGVCSFSLPPSLCLRVCVCVRAHMYLRGFNLEIIDAPACERVCIHPFVVGASWVPATGSRGLGCVQSKGAILGVDVVSQSFQATGCLWNVYRSGGFLLSVRLCDRCSILQYIGCLFGVGRLQGLRNQDYR